MLQLHGTCGGQTQERDDGSLELHVRNQHLPIGEASKKKNGKFGPLAETGGGSGPVRRSQLSYLVIRNVKTTSHFLKVTPLIWAIEGKNNQ